MPRGRGRGRGRRRGSRRRDFWQAWYEERRRLREEHDEPGGITEDEMMTHWRQFFREYMGTTPEEHWAFGGRRFNPWHQGVDAFNPFVANLLSKGGGLLPLLVLHLLDQEPRYGGAVMDWISDATGGQWVANPGAIYPLMTTLEKQGFITGEWEDPTKRTVRIYHLTDAGQQELERLRGVVQPKLVKAAEALQRFADDLGGEDASNEDDGDGIEIV